MESNHHLLCGVLAYQNRLITCAQLFDAVNEWMQDKSRPVDQRLLDKGWLAESDQRLLAELLHSLLGKQAEGDLLTIGVGSETESVLRELRALEDPDIFRTLGPSESGGTDLEPAIAPTSNRGMARFRILRPHQEGGLGRVSVALDTELDREVAFKEIKPLFSDDTVSRIRFSREAEITGKLEHPGIVPIYALGTSDDGRPYYAMRFIKGDNLSQAIRIFHKEHGEQSPLGDSLEFRRLLGRFLDVCNAVHFAHERGVLHRDLKPGNIMLGEYGETLVVDWGLAKYYQSISAGSMVNPGTKAIEVQNELLSEHSAEEATILGTAMGSPHYMSPEQARGEHDRLGPAADVYSLGTTLFTLLTNHKPFEGSSVQEVLKQVQQGPSRTAIQLKCEVDPALNAICERAMALKVEDRYCSARDLADDIERFLNDDPVEAYAEPWASTSRRWIRKHPRIAGSLVAAALLGTISAAAIAGLTANNNRRLNEKNVELAQTNQQLDSARGTAEEAQAEAEQKQRDAEKARDAARAAQLKAERARAAIESILESDDFQVWATNPGILTDDRHVLERTGFVGPVGKVIVSLKIAYLYDEAFDFALAKARISKVEEVLEAYLEGADPARGANAKYLDTDRIDIELAQLAHVSQLLIRRLEEPLDADEIKHHLRTIANWQRKIKLAEQDSTSDAAQSSTAEFSINEEPARADDDIMETFPELFLVLDNTAYTQESLKRERQAIADQFKQYLITILQVGCERNSIYFIPMFGDPYLDIDQEFAEVADEPRFVELRRKYAPSPEEINRRIPPNTHPGEQKVREWMKELFPLNGEPPNLKNLPGLFDDGATEPTK